MKDHALKVVLGAALVVAALVLRARDRGPAGAPQAPRAAGASEAPGAPQPSAARQTPGTPKGARTPEDVVSAFFDAAGRGDDAAYLTLVGGEIARALRNARSEAGLEAFRRNLRRSADGIKGLGMTRGGGAPAGLVAIDVDIVFADRNERQRFLLAPRRGGWVITEIGAAETVKPAIPYGTPVFEP